LTGLLHAIGSELSDPEMDDLVSKQLFTKSDSLFSLQKQIKMEMEGNIQNHRITIIFIFLKD
jgi:hypothetical protein